MASTDGWGPVHSVLWEAVVYVCWRRARGLKRVGGTGLCAGGGLYITAVLLSWTRSWTRSSLSVLHSWVRCTHKPGIRKPGIRQ